MLIELNEFDPAFLRDAALRLGLQNIPRLLNMRRSLTGTADRVEHSGLDPWVQWVGIHSGMPTAEHGVLRLGSTREQARPQIWNVLGRDGYRWGVWGAMNAPLGDARGCAFFMPDPWSFDEVAHPAPLNDILALPRYVSKNYLDIDRFEAVRQAARFARFFLRPTYFGQGIRFVTDAIRLVRRSRVPIDVHTFTTLLDYLSTLVFVQLRRRAKPDFSVVFLNHIAHLQHHYWKRGSLHPQMELGVRVCDAVVGMILASRRPGEALVVMNAFRQENVDGQGVVCYRQRNPAEAMRALGIPGGRVEQCMTNDAHVIFETGAEADAAEEVLRGCEISDGRKVFYVERRDANSLFYQVDFDRRVADDAILAAPGRTLPFFDVFECFAERTGAHVPEGDAYSEGIDLPPEFANHEAFELIRRHFDTNDVPGAVGHDRDSEQMLSASSAR